MRAGQVFVNEWFFRYRLTDRFFASYGRENLQWGPSFLISPSNPFIERNGKNNPYLEVPGLDYAKINWIVDSSWSAQLIANTAWFNDAGIIPDQYRLLFAVGFCGSFTTLSSMVLELNTMIQKNELFYSFTYLVGTLVGGFACFYLGIVIMRAVLQLQNG